MRVAAAIAVAMIVVSMTMTGCDADNIEVPTLPGEENTTPTESEGGLTLQIDGVKLSDGRFISPGDGESEETGNDKTTTGQNKYNENAINRATIFFYPYNADEFETEAVECKTVENLHGIGTCKITDLIIEAENRAILFSEGKCRVYVIANLPPGTTYNAKSTIAEAKSIKVMADFRSEYITDESGNVIAEPMQSDFVMTGEGVIELAGDQKQVTGSVMLKRTAAKMRLSVTVDNVVKAPDPYDPKEDIEWVPNIEGMRLYITNGVRMAHVGGAEFTRDELEAAIATIAEGENQNIENNGFYRISADATLTEEGDFVKVARRMTSEPGRHDGNQGEEENGTTYPIWNESPIYTYPHSWENTPTETRQMYLVLQVPWTPKAEGYNNYQESYYQVPINLRGEQEGETWKHQPNTIESNMYYLMRLHIGMLGSYNPEYPLDVKAEYFIVPWQTESIGADLRDNRYLVVDELTWEAHNMTDVTIPFYTSHKTVVARVKYRFWNFNPAASNGDNDETPFKYNVDGEEIDIDYDGKELPRVVEWLHNGSNTVFNESIRQQRIVSGRQSVESEDSIVRWSLDNNNMTLSVHQDLMRWTEYTTTGNNNAEVLVFGGKMVYGHTRSGETLTERQTSGQYEIKGYYGKYNGETKYLKKGKAEDQMRNWTKVEVEVTIIHEDELANLDNSRFQQTVKIILYPPMYVEPERSPEKSQNKGYVFVNGNDSNIGVSDQRNSPTEYWKTVVAASGTNSNPNMYVITISQLDDEYSDYIIGDPRTLAIDNTLSNESVKSTTAYNSTWTSSTNQIYSKGDESRYERGDFDALDRYNNFTVPTPAPAIFSESESDRELKYYYPTDELNQSGFKDRVIAPKLRIASSYGQIGGMTTREMGRRRCAAYQEAGYPAGRWRLPTQAEIEFITKLSSEGRIPLLFTPWKAQAVYKGKPIVHNYNAIYGYTIYANYPHYWSAQGAAYIDATDGNKVKIRKPQGTNAEIAGDSNNREQVAVRCVYDEWYWTDKCALNQFTWGDQPKGNPQN